jgi:thiol-disulfide isomerase/thioredoxin
VSGSIEGAPPCIDLSPVAWLAVVLLLSGSVAVAAERIYPAVSAANADIAAALKDAAATHRRVIVDFGGDWCTDCKVLDLNFHEPTNAKLLQRHYVLVHVNVGDKGIKDNFDVAERYGIPLRKGVPALAVLESDGRLVYSQKNGEFESMRSMDRASVTGFPLGPEVGGCRPRARSDSHERRARDLGLRCNCNEDLPDSATMVVLCLRVHDRGSCRSSERRFFVLGISRQGRRAAVGRGAGTPPRLLYPGRMGIEVS